MVMSGNALFQLPKDFFHTSTIVSANEHDSYVTAAEK